MNSFSDGKFNDNIWPSRPTVTGLKYIKSKELLIYNMSQALVLGDCFSLLSSANPLRSSYYDLMGDLAIFEASGFPFPSDAKTFA